MALKIQTLISKLLAEYYILRLFCILGWISFSVFSYAKIINHTVEQEVELERSPCQLSTLTIRPKISISTFTRLLEAKLRASG